MAVHDIAINPEVMLGKPVIAGTRITVEHVLRRLAAGESMADLVSSHPLLTETAIRAALDYAAEAVSHERAVDLNDHAA